MVERYHRPCILLAFTGDAGSGSGRSISGFDLHAGVTACAETLSGAGGHAMAVGVRCARDRFEDFRAAFEAAADSAIPAEARRGELRLDAEVSLAMLTPNLLQALEVLEPFGLGNPSPAFFVGGLKVVGEPRKVGNGERHLSFAVQALSGGPVRKAIGFDMADRLDELLGQNGECCLAFTPHANEFRGQTSVDLRLRDLQAGPTLRRE
jgi:single-stranded-DNA-specific exonuclease